MSEAKLQAARELIEEKKYLEARAILITIKNDPTAARWIARIDDIRAKYDAKHAPPQPTYVEPVRSEGTGTASFFRIVWGILTLLSIGWMCYGLTVTATVTNNQLETAQARSSEAYQAGTMLGASAGLSFFVCSGLPFLLVFGLLYWRNGVAIREAKRHEQTIEAMRRR
jgi:hypothetical protein